MPPRYPIESVDRALQILEQLRTSSTLRLSDVARDLGVAKSTAHRMLAALEHRGMVAPASDGKAFVAGPGLVGIARAVLLRHDPQLMARPLVESLVASFGETVHLGVIDGHSVRYVLSSESPKAVRVAGRTGRTLPLHATGTGKALLCGSTDDEIRALYDGIELRSETDRSITDVDELIAELAASREHGYAVNDGESEEGVVSIAVPIRLSDGSVFAAISVAAPSYRIPATEADAIAQRMFEIIDRFAPPAP